MDSFIQNLSDKDLVEDCLAGKDQAWQRLKELIQRISLFRIYGGKFSEEAEETADQILFSLWWNDCHILRGFDPDKGSLRRYFTAVVKHFAQQAKRRGQIERARLREYAARQYVTSNADDEQTLRTVLEEFSTRFRGGLKRYFQEKYLGILSKGKAKKYSKQNAWKLDQRLRDEWRRFFSS